MNRVDYPFDREYILTKKRKLKKELMNVFPFFVKKRIAILGGSTTANIKDTLEIFLLNYGIEATFYESEYCRYYEDAVFSNSHLDEFKPEIVYVCTTVRNILQWPDINDGEDKVNQLLNNEIDKYRRIWDSLYERYQCTIIQNNVELPPHRLMGNYEAVADFGSVNYVMRLNLLISQEIQKRNYLHLIDLNYIASDYGITKWHDMVAWYSYKYAMSLDAIPDLAYNVANVIKAVLGKNKKVIVLDMDNTLWGGVIGDDGIDNILLGSETPIGHAYSDFQKFVKKYTELGILLAINSKNEYENALAGLAHPDSILKKEDFVSIKANWMPKDVNLQTIASELSLGTDSFVFIDDNPAERMIVSENIPVVSAPDIRNVTDYIQIIDHAGYFETVSISADDRKRNAMYLENANRMNMASTFTDYGEYLKALDMKATMKPFESVYIARITQLTNKSNQFNLTTKRYTQEEIENIADSDDHITLYGRLEDKFGDNGIVTVVIGKIQEETCSIELWLMSCRVLKRTMEYAMMDTFIEKCKKKGIRIIEGVYIPTAKNGMVKDFYKDMGFSLIAEDGDITTWQLDITNKISKKNKYIQIGG